MGEVTPPVENDFLALALLLLAVAALIALTGCLPGVVTVPA